MTLNERLDRRAAERMMLRLHDGIDQARPKTRDEMMIECFLLRHCDAVSLADTIEAGISEYDATGQWPRAWVEET